MRFRRCPRRRIRLEDEIFLVVDARNSNGEWQQTEWNVDNSVSNIDGRLVWVDVRPLTPPLTPPPLPNPANRTGGLLNIGRFGPGTMGWANGRFGDEL